MFIRFDRIHERDRHTYRMTAWAAISIKNTVSRDQDTLRPHSLAYVLSRISAILVLGCTSVGSQLLDVEYPRNDTR